MEPGLSFQIRHYPGAPALEKSLQGIDLKHGDRCRGQLEAAMPQALGNGNIALFTVLSAGLYASWG